MSQVFNQQLLSSDIITHNMILYARDWCWRKIPENKRKNKSATIYCYYRANHTLVISHYTAIKAPCFLTSTFEGGKRELIKIIHYVCSARKCYEENYFLKCGLSSIWFTDELKTRSCFHAQNLPLHQKNRQRNTFKGVLLNTPRGFHQMNAGPSMIPCMHDVHVNRDPF